MSRNHIRDVPKQWESGWKLWRVQVSRQGAVLASVDRDCRWDDRIMRAACLPPVSHVGTRDWYRRRRQQPEHASPAPICECGISSYRSRSDAESDEILGRGSLRAVGPVELSERIINGVKEIRAEAARLIGPIDLMGECSIRHDHQVGSVYIEPESLQIRCEPRSGWMSAAQYMWTIANQLEARYQVEFRLPQWSTQPDRHA